MGAFVNDDPQKTPFNCIPDNHTVPKVWGTKPTNLYSVIIHLQGPHCRIGVLMTDSSKQYESKTRQLLSDQSFLRQV